MSFPKIHFRPLPGFSLLALVMFSVLVALGVWQLERLEWKLALISEINRNLQASPIPVGQALRMGAAMQYRRAALRGEFLNAKEVYLFTADSRGEPVYHVLVPFRLNDGRVLIVDRGLVPPLLRSPSTRPRGELNGEQSIVGVMRVPDAPGVFTPAPDTGQRIWYARDISGIASVEHLHLAAPVIVEADAAPNPGGWPKGGQTVVNLPNNHLQYAITWFLLASALVIVYLAYHRARGRLAFDRN